MAQKTVSYNKKGIATLPNNAPSVYKILTPVGTNNYTGVAQRGRTQEKIEEHLGKIPGAKGCGSRMATLTMVFKLIQSAQKRWQRLRGYEKVENVWAGIKFEDGLMVKDAVLITA